MEIKVIEEFGQINISSKRHVENLINSINNNGLGNDKEIILDITGCQTDYPETPKLVDLLLFHLSKLDGEKYLKIIFNGLGNKELFLLHDLILEGNYFEILNKINDPSDVSIWTEIMNQKLKENNIIMTILYVPENKTYTYGS